MKSLPGVTVRSASAGNANESISMQGMSSSYVKIMIDGVAVSTDMSGSTPIFQLPVENIDHIEVIKGSDSVLYGSQAMGGVINIVTKSPEKSDKSESSGEEKDKVKFSGSLTDSFGFSPVIIDWKNYLAGTFFIKGSHVSNVLMGSFDYNPGKVSYTYDALAGKIAYYESTKKVLGFIRDTFTWTEKWGNLGCYALYTDSLQESNYTKTGYDKGSTMEYDSSRAEFGINSKFKSGDNWNFQAFSVAKAYFLDTSYNVQAGSYSSSRQTLSNSVDWESDFRAFCKAGKYNKIIFGANANFESIDGTSFEERKYALETSVFAQDTISLFDEKFAIVPGLRFDYSPSIQESGSFYMATPKLSMKYNPTKKIALRCSYGMGYKVPSLKEKYWVFKHNYAPGSGNFILYGNPDLVPEKSHGVNLGYEQNVLNLFKFSIDAYYNYILDLIDSVLIDASSSPQIRQYQNIDEAMTFGGDFLISTKLDRLEIQAGYAYNCALYYKESTGSWEHLALRIPHKVTLSFDYKIPVIETDFYMNGEWNSPQLLNAEVNYYSPDYLMLNAGFSKKFLEDKLEVSLSCENILNNIHFIQGSNGENQKDYFGLYDGAMLNLALKYNF